MCVCVRAMYGYVNLDCTHKGIYVNSVFEMSGFVQLYVPTTRHCLTRGPKSQSQRAVDWKLHWEPKESPSLYKQISMHICYSHSKLTSNVPPRSLH